MFKFKYLAVITILVLCVFLFTGCTANDTSSEYANVVEATPAPTPDNVGGLVVIKPRHNVDRYLYEVIAYDSYTKVMYIIVDDGRSGSSSISPLYNFDGSLRIYEPN